MDSGALVKKIKPDMHSALGEGGKMVASKMKHVLEKTQFSTQYVEFQKI